MSARTGSVVVLKPPVYSSLLQLEKPVRARRTTCRPTRGYVADTARRACQRRRADAGAGAGKLLRTINGAARIVSSTYRPVELSGAFRDSFDRQHVVVGAATAHARAHVFAVAVVTSADGQPVRQPPSPAPDYIQLAAQHPDVADALTILGKPAPLDWFDLYKLYEIVRDNVDPSPPGQSRKGNQKKLIDTGWLTKPDLSAFTGSANHQLASGDAARHAREPGSGPTRTMSLDEGTQFIRDLVARWLPSFT